MHTAKSILLGCWQTLNSEYKILISTRQPVGFMQSWNCTSHFKSHAYLKLPGETWNEMCYLKLFNPSQELLIWNFQMRLETRCAIWNFSIHHRGCLFETFRGDLKWDMLSETFEMFETWNCLNILWELLIWNFQMRLGKKMWYSKPLMKLFKPIKGVAYLKLLNETWNEMCYLKLYKLLKLCIWNFSSLKLWSVL